MVSALNEKAKKIGLIFLGLIFFTLITILIIYFLEPTSLPYSLFFSNITDHQLTVSFITDKPTRGALYISETGNFPLIPKMIMHLQKDDGEKNLKQAGFYTTHLITMGNLKPETTYQFRILEGLHQVYQGQFKTGPTLDSLLNPNPIFGKVLRSDKKTPVAGALVYLRTGNDASQSAILTTLTGVNGGWSLDLANLRTKDLTKPLILDKSVKENIIVDAGSLGRVKAQTIPGKDQPWPTILLNQ